MNKNNFVLIIECVRKGLDGKDRVSFNELRRKNPIINTTAEFFQQALKEHSAIVPADLKFSQKKGTVDPSVIVDLEIEKVRNS
jgi:hypothetical protein